MSDGGPAFPCAIHDSITLRDYFAAQVIGAAVQAERFEMVGAGRITEESLARHAYLVADAMLEARKR